MNTFLFLLLMIPGTFLLGVNDVLVRKVLRGGTFHQQLLLGIDFLGSAIVLIVPLAIVGIPEIKPGFWEAFTATVILNIFAQWAWFAAFKKEEASLIAPLRLLSPPFVILTGFLVLGEKIALAGAIGIFITIFGLWFLGHSEKRLNKGKLINFLKRPGVILGILGALLFAVSLPFDKKAILTSSPIFFIVIAFTFVGLANMMIGFLSSGRQVFFADLKHNWKTIIYLPFVHGLASWLTFSALLFAPAAYASSVKRLWSLWAVILGGAFLNERNISKRLIAVLIVLGGIAITVFLG